MRFKTIVLVGSGQLVKQCALYIKEKIIDSEGVTTCKLRVYYTDRRTYSMFVKKAQDAEIEYECLEKKEIVMRLLELSEATLVISAINPYIIPADVLMKTNITGINCHQALLPAYPGRNAEAWVIYEQEKKTGITWHYMTKEIDGGKILIQKELPLTAEATAAKVFRKQIQLAYEGFTEIIRSFLVTDIAGREQKADKNKMHYKSQVPNDGMFNLNWNGAKMSAFLRAMDYGILKVLGEIKIEFENERYLVKKYQICEINTKEAKQSMNQTILKYKEDKLLIQKDGIKIELTIQKESE